MISSPPSSDINELIERVRRIEREIVTLKAEIEALKIRLSTESIGDLERRVRLIETILTEKRKLVDVVELLREIYNDVIKLTTEINQLKQRVENIEKRTAKKRPFIF